MSHPFRVSAATRHTQQGASSGAYARGTTRSSTALENVIVIENTKVICKGEACLRTNHATAQQISRTIELVNRFFDQEFGIKGIDGRGKMAPVNLWRNNNASWSCSSYMGGKKCEWNFNDSYARDPAVVAHEYMHAVVDTLYPLGHIDESGALHESLGDVFGIAFRAWSTGQVNWSIADRNISTHVDVSSFKYRKGIPSNANDFGHVHDNSLIPSHAFSEAALTLKEQFPRNNTFPIITKIWLASVQQIRKEATSFKEFANLTVQKTKEITQNRLATRLVEDAWLHVGINPKG